MGRVFHGAYGVGRIYDPVLGLTASRRDAGLLWAAWSWRMGSHIADDASSVARLKRNAVQFPWRL